jgi:DNA invertase Pin-like site-specific DNA recombinase
MISNSTSGASRTSGVSAFRGKNAATGMLGEFIELVRSGAIPRGGYLLIENLDRLSRMTPRRAVRLLEEIVDEGITVVTSDDKKTLDEEPMSFMLAFHGGL